MKSYFGVQDLLILIFFLPLVFSLKIQQTLDNSASELKTNSTSREPIDCDIKGCKNCFNNSTEPGECKQCQSGFLLIDHKCFEELKLKEYLKYLKSGLSDIQLSILSKSADKIFNDSNHSQADFIELSNELQQLNSMINKLQSTSKRELQLSINQIISNIKNNLSSESNSIDEIQTKYENTLVSELRDFTDNQNDESGIDFKEKLQAFVGKIENLAQLIEYQFQKNLEVISKMHLEDNGIIENISRKFDDQLEFENN